MVWSHVGWTNRTNTHGTKAGRTIGKTRLHDCCRVGITRGSPTTCQHATHDASMYSIGSSCISSGRLPRTILALFTNRHGRWNMIRLVPSLVSLILSGHDLPTLTHLSTHSPVNRLVSGQTLQKTVFCTDVRKKLGKNYTNLWSNGSIILPPLPSVHMRPCSCHESEEIPNQPLDYLILLT